MTDQDNGLVANKNRSISQIIVKNADQGDAVDKQPEVVAQTISPAQKASKVQSIKEKLKNRVQRRKQLQD